MTTDIRELSGSDTAALQDFLTAMPAEDRTFFFWDVDDPSVIAQWTGHGRRISRAMVDADGRVIAFAALTPGTDWSSHVADLVLAVGADHRRRGLGRTLARAMLIEAVKAGFLKVTVLIAAGNDGPLRMFRNLGFSGEGLLRDHLRSPEDDTLHDVMLLAHLVDDTWSSMLTGGFEEALR